MEMPSRVVLSCVDRVPAKLLPVPWTPGVVLTRSSTLRVARGRSRTLYSGRTAPTEADVVAISVSAATLTSTVWDCVPTCSVKFNRTCCDTPSDTSLYVCVWKPARSAETLYCPDCSEGKLYAPVSFVIVVDTIPVCVFVAVTITPGISAPDASETVPPRVAFVV